MVLVPCWRSGRRRLALQPHKQFLPRYCWGFSVPDLYCYTSCTRMVFQVSFFGDFCKQFSVPYFYFYTSCTCMVFQVSFLVIFVNSSRCHTFIFIHIHVWCLKFSFSVIFVNSSRCQTFIFIHHVHKSFPFW